MEKSVINVFISSKQIELREDRLIVANTINSLRNMRAVMAEDWVPQRQIVHQVYLQDVLRCPIYLGLFWKVFSDPTVREYEAAHSNEHTEILLYVKDCPDSERDGPLRTLIQRFEENHVPRRFRSAAELMTTLPQHLDAAVDRMLEKLTRLGQTARSGPGPRALKSRKAQQVVLEAWDLSGEPEKVIELLNDVRAGLKNSANRP
jgi:hypothetical protein